MAMHRTKGTIIGLLEASRVNEWIVTEKLGDASKPKSTDLRTPLIATPRLRIGERYPILISFLFFFSSYYYLPFSSLISFALH